MPNLDNFSEEDRTLLFQAHMEYRNKLTEIATRNGCSLESLIETNQLKIPIDYQIKRKKYVDSAFNVFQRNRALQMRTSEAESGLAY